MRRSNQLSYEATDVAKIAFITARIIASLEHSVTYQESPPWLPRTFKTPCVETICTQSSHGKIGKEEPWRLEIISYWSDKLSSILDYFTLVDSQFSAKVRCYLFITSSNPHASPSSDVLVSHLPESPRPHVPASPRPHVPESPRPRPTFSNSYLDLDLEDDL